MWGRILGLLSLLSEEDPELQSYALKNLDQSVSISWPQISEKIEVIKKLASKLDFIDHKRAALLASKVSYYLNDLDAALEYALLSKDLFDINKHDDYTTKVISHSIQCYVKFIKEQKSINNVHSQFINRIFQSLLKEKKYMNVLCLSIETHTLDLIRSILNEKPSLTPEAISLTIKTVNDYKYKQSLLKLFVDFSITHQDKFQLSQLYSKLEDAKSMADLLVTLSTSGNEDQLLLAYQISFELAENASQKFLSNIISRLPSSMTSIVEILQRTKLLKLNLEFLFKRNHSNIKLLILLKDTFDSMRPIVQTSIVLSYAFMYAGTADDNFYRNNTHWFINAQKWSQFITAVAVGVIHIGHLEDAMKILDSFLRPEAPEFVFGGALLALGLIFANYSWDKLVIEKVVNTLNSPRTLLQIPVMHGACLALGLISMGSHNIRHYEILRKILYLDIPEPGEAAGYAMGMVMLGSGYSIEKVVDEMVEFANSTQHEKIMRGLAMGLAFVMYGMEETADKLVDNLLKNSNPLMRESAMWITALSYVGTASNIALKKLLHSAVSDTNDYVRRTAVIGVGFILSRSPNEVPSIIDLLSKSFNPHIRCGSALALGIACAGTGLKEAIKIIAPLLNDSEDVVKQIAIISMGMVMMQQSEKIVPYAAKFRTFLQEMIDRKIRKNDLLIFAVCVACGILNAGGRNVVISCNSLRGENSAVATVGLALFCNHFFWNPLSLMLILSFHPTAIIGLNSNLKVADWWFKCNASPSTFGYKPTIDCNEFTCENILSKSSVLKSSFLSKNSDDQSTKNLKKNEKNSDDNDSSLAKNHSFSLSNENEEEEKCEEDSLFEEEEEPQFEILQNMSRVTPQQLKYIENDEQSHYKPITSLSLGFVMLKKV